ncbi:MAG: amidohydrolase [Balneolaceae bacterium]|nr:amidohydrolase [Balneolaceae bacterium]
MFTRILLYIIPFLITTYACSPDFEEGFIYDNVNGYTLNQNGELIEFEAIAVRDGKVLGTGTSIDIVTEYPNLERIDGEGNTLLPGLIDAHAHVMGLGIRELDVNVAGIRSLEETLETVRQFAEENPGREWITGRGWNQVLWEENEFPTAEDLDRVVPGRPVYLTRVDGHAAWANTLAMEMAGINRDTPDLQGGVILRNDDGEATGIFVDATMQYLREVIPERTEEDYEQALELALEKMARYGITSVHDASTGSYEWALYQRFADEGKLTTRIYAMIAGTGDTFDDMSADGPVYSYADDLLSLRSVKISADGALGSRGAALLEDYHDDPGNKGLLFYSQDELNQMLLKGASAGFQMNIHAIGDAANRQVLDAFEFIYDELDNQQELRHRVEHAQVVALNDISRFATLDIIASMQPTHATSDMNMAEDRVGSERIAGAYAWQKFLEQGTVIAGGSDFPVEDVNPFYGLYSAVTRQDHHGMPPEGWYSEQRMSRTDALRAFTLDAAFSAHQDDVTGTLKPGKHADFILIDRDYFEVPTSEIWQIEVLETWLSGNNVYQQ